MKKLLNLLYLLPLWVSAQGLGSAPAPINIAPPSDFATSILNIINFILGLIGAIALAFFIYGVFRYITAGSNEDQLAESKGTMTSALIGILVMAIAAALINFVVGLITGNIGTGSAI